MKNSLKEQYKKERKRVLQYINRTRKQGKIVNIEVPKIPKRITTGSVSRLKKLTPKKLTENAIYVRPETGEIISKTEWKKERKQSNTRKNSYVPTFDIFSVIREMLLSIPNERAFYKKGKVIRYDYTGKKNILVSFLDDLMNESGSESYLLSKQETIGTYINLIMRESKDEQVESTFIRIADLLARHPLTRQEAEEVNWFG